MAAVCPPRSHGSSTRHAIPFPEIHPSRSSADYRCPALIDCSVGGKHNYLRRAQTFPGCVAGSRLSPLLLGRPSLRPGLSLARPPSQLRPKRKMMMNGGGGRGDANARAGFGEEEREQEECTFVHFSSSATADPADGKRPQSRGSDSASIHFLTDDREVEEVTELLAEDFAQLRLTQQFRLGQPSHPGMASAGDGQVDYSPSDFQRAKAAIEDAAARQRRETSDKLSRRRVKQIGDCTVITEHRDPYSFYWQLDQLRREEKQPTERGPAPAEYVLEEPEQDYWDERHSPSPEILGRQPKLRGEEEQPEEDLDFLSPDSGVHLLEREREEETYARPVKTEDPASFSHYWHVDSGIRREEPRPAKRRQMPSEPAPPPIVLHRLPAIAATDSTTQTRTFQSQPLVEEHAFRQTTTKRRVDLTEEKQDRGFQQDIRFSVFPLGSVELAESELEGVERSQATLEKVMVRQRADVPGNGNGRQMLLELGPNELRLLDANGEEVLRRERLESIRIWGVGMENPREFAFVTRDPSADNIPVCHVFQCEGPAREVANALNNCCERMHQQQQHPEQRRRPYELLERSSGQQRRRTRESVLVTPTYEPKRVIRCHFVGVTQVSRATGIDMLNSAVDRLVSQVHRDKWILVDVAVCPSSISILEATDTKRQIGLCRVRYLSFLGIGRDIKHCAFIVAQSQDYYICYVFHAEPSAGPLAKCIEAACKLRYQRIFDAHVKIPPSAMLTSHSKSK